MGAGFVDEAGPPAVVWPCEPHTPRRVADSLIECGAVMETSSCSFVYSNTGGDGPAVVLLHGVLMNGTLWDDVVDGACVVRTAKQVRGVLERNPLREVVSDPSRYLVTFLSQEPDPEMVEALLGEDHSPEAIAIEGAEAYVGLPMASRR